MGIKLREAREAKGMTQEELAAKSGISRQTISAIENNDERETKVSTLLAIANAMEMTVDEIFFRDAV